MMKALWISHFILISLVNATGQKRTTEFNIEPSKKAVANSLYKTIHYIDSRTDTAYMGTVASGLLHSSSDVIFNPTMQVQLSNIIDHLIDNTAKEGGLLFQLRHLVFSQKPGAFSNKGYCFLKAELYSDKTEKYVPLATIDTMILVKSLTTGTASLFDAAGDCITAFVADNLLDTGSDTLTYTYNDVINIDSLEKAKIPIYNATGYVDGIYEIWESFKNQKPDWTSTLIVEQKDSNITKVAFIDNNNEKQKLVSKKVYAIVYKGQPYISTDYGFYLAQKRDNNFFFTGKAKVYSGTGARVISRQFLGPLSALYELNQSSTFEFKIDHTDGGFIRNKEISGKG